MDPEAYAKHNKPEKGERLGVYRHPKTGEKLLATSHPAADAYVRQQWVYEGPLPSNEELRENTKSEPSEKVPSVDEVKKLRESLKAEKEARKAAEEAAKQAEAEAEQAKADAGAALQAAEEAEAKAKATSSDEKKTETGKENK